MAEGQGRRRMRAMNVGCGTGKMAESLAEAGFGNVVHTDVSPACVQLMREAYGTRLEGHTFEVDDATQMKFADGEFDLVIDKGTLDALHCAGDSPCLAMVAEVHRVLKPGGKICDCLAELQALLLLRGPRGRRRPPRVDVPRRRSLGYRPERRVHRPWPPGPRHLRRQVTRVGGSYFIFHIPCFNALDAYTPLKRAARPTNPASVTPHRTP